jgi:hypothetical protein
MSLNRRVQNSILHEIARWKNIITNKSDLSPIQKGKGWNYVNESDWRYGHFIGMIEGLAILYHHVTHHRQITSEELKEIESFIMENTKNLRNDFYENKMT